MKTNLIHKAIEFSSIKHLNQTRKNSNVPYISHPIEVALTLSKYKCSEELIIAGLLHDTIEDTNTTLEEINLEFGEKVAYLVSNESEDKTKSWEERKQETINKLLICEKEVAFCTLADKISNLNSIYADIKKIGEEVWERFNRPKQQQEWYYKTIATSTKRFSKYAIWREYNNLVNLIFN